MVVGQYFAKYAGSGAAGTPMPPWSQTAWSFLNAFVGMAMLGLISTYLVEPQTHLHLLVAAFGAMSVLLFSAIKAPVSQPFNTIGGNTLGAIVGVVVVGLLEFVGLDDRFWLSGALCVSLTIALQELTNTVHPPGGATALIFSLMKPLHQEHFLYVLAPALLGSVLMVATATVMNNLSSERSYPQFWSPMKKQSPPEDAIRMLEVEAVPESGTESSTEGPSCCQSACKGYFHKFAGAGGEPGPRPKLSETGFSFLGAFVGMSTLGLLDTYVLGPVCHMKVEVAAFGAMSVLIFSTCKAPLAQPVNAVLGNTIGGAVGVGVVSGMHMLGMEHLLWTTAALSVALTIALQERTNTLHPPGGATALLYAITPPMQKFGAEFVFAPAFLGAVIMVAMGTVMNNFSPERTYPQRWLFDDSSKPSKSESKSEEKPVP